ncbi:hypothetical protein EGW08_020447 [Elysia chlorotica]|uniref:Uncharacterized protein n=1 Tax=Elysia chlorotica TaxID=188477 RepID=A0A433SRA0_ELYCH|nr:hypothetical protein EGW08_020447 [Elysia chlorotica]
MREGRSRSQNIVARNSRVRAVQSTQLNLERLEQELSFTPEDTEYLGDGDILRSKGWRCQSAKQLKSFPSRSESNHQGHSGDSESKDINRENFANKLSEIKTCCNGAFIDPCHSIHAEADGIIYAKALTFPPLRHLSDDNNKNACAPITNKEGTGPGLEHCFLDQANNAKSKSFCSPRSKVSLRKRKSRHQAKSSKRDKPRKNPTSNQKLINLPPNCVLKITSKSSVSVQHKKRKEADYKSGTTSPAPAKKSERISGPEKSCPLSNAAGPSRRSVEESNSSRYRLTPCPVDGTSSWRSRQSSCSSVLNSASRLCSPGKMAIRARSSSGRLASARSRSGKRSSKYNRSCSTRSRRKRARSQYQLFPKFVTSNLLLGRTGSRAKTSGASLYCARRSRKFSSTQRRRSRSSSKTSATSGRRKRGRPRGVRPKRAAGSFSESGHMSKSNGLLDRMSRLWRSVSASKSATSTVHNRSSSPSSSSGSDSWVSRMLPLPRSKHQARLQSHRDKAYKYRRVRADQQVKPRRPSKAASNTTTASKRQQKAFSYCSIM